MRLGRLAVESVTDTIPGYTFELGKGSMLRDGTDATIIATGMMVQMAPTRLPKPWLPRAFPLRVIDMHTIKPMDKEHRAESRRRKPAASSPPRKQTSSAVLALPLPRWYPRAARFPWCATASTTSLAAPARLRPCWTLTSSTPEGIAEKVRYALTLKK